MQLPVSSCLPKRNWRQAHWTLYLSLLRKVQKKGRELLPDSSFGECVLHPWALQVSGDLRSGKDAEGEERNMLRRPLIEAGGRHRLAALRHLHSSCSRSGEQRPSGQAEPQQEQQARNIFQEAEEEELETIAKGGGGRGRSALQEARDRLAEEPAWTGDGEFRPCSSLFAQQCRIPVAVESMLNRFHS